CLVVVPAITHDPANHPESTDASGDRAVDKYWSILELLVGELEKIVSIQLVGCAEVDGNVEIAHSQLLHFCLLALPFIFGVRAQVDDDLDACVLALSEMLGPRLAACPHLIG